MSHATKKDLASTIFLIGVILFCAVVVAYSQSRSSREEIERWYNQWLMSGGWKVIEAEQAREAQVRQVQLEYNALQSLQKAYNLTIEIDRINRDLNKQLNAKGELWNKKLSSTVVEVAIKKLSKELKDKANDLAKEVR